MFDAPVRVRVAGGRDQQRVVSGRIESGSELERTILGFRLHAAARELEPALFQDPQPFRSKSIPAPGEADRGRHADPFQLSFYLLQLAGEIGGVLRRGEIPMSPGVIADFESHLVDLRDVPPGHEMFLVVHPTLRVAEAGSKSELFQKGRDENAMRFYCVVEREDDGLRRDAGGRRRQRPESHGEKTPALHVAYDSLIATGMRRNVAYPLVAGAALDLPDGRIRPSGFREGFAS